MKRTRTASRTAAPLANAALWAFAARMLAKMIDWFGPPGELADAGAVNARFVWEIMPWFKRLEGLVRRLVIAEAATMTYGLRIGAARAPGALAARQLSPAGSEGGNRLSPETWRVRFHVGLRGGAPRSPPPPGPRRGPRIAIIPPISEPHTIPTLPLARRLEAISRVVADPSICARRLAARLARTPALAARLRRPGPRLAPGGPFRDSYPDILRQAHRRMTAALDGLDSS